MVRMSVKWSYPQVMMQVLGSNSNGNKEILTFLHWPILLFSRDLLTCSYYEAFALFMHIDMSVLLSMHFTSHV